MITGIVLAILGFLLAVVLVAMFRGPGRRKPAVTESPAKPAAPRDALEADAWDARKGDVISINGGAEDYSDLDFPVDRRSAYESKNRRWVDLSGEFRGQRVYLEVYRYPEPDLIGILDGRRLGLTDLNVTEDRLADLDSKQDPSESIAFENKRWLYESSREIGYFENETGEGEGLYRWLFREENGPRLLCIEKWEGEPFDVRIARRLKPQEITVYRAG